VHRRAGASQPPVQQRHDGSSPAGVHAVLL
jgi:hypothetical protein